MSEQFFSVMHSIPVNVEPLPAGSQPPSLEALEAELPTPFRIAGSISHVDVGTARQLRNMGDEFGVLVDVINQQSAKINVLLSYLLSQLDDPQYRRHTQRFGGSELVFVNPQPLATGTLLRMKLFLSDQASAIYCYGQVVDNIPQEPPQEPSHEPSQEQAVLVTVHYAALRPDDRELLVRASLHIQSLQLKLRAEQRLHDAKSAATHHDSPTEL